MSSFASRKAPSRYSSFDSQTSPSSSAEFKSVSSNPKSFLRNEAPKTNAIVKANKVKTEQNFAAMVKKFMEKKSNSSSKPKNNGDRALPLIVPADFIAEDLKKSARKGSNLSALPKKLFGKGSNSSSNSTSGDKKAKALTEVKTNTRTLAMVLRSERELLTLNKDQETEISDLKSLLQERNLEVEKLKNLCLKQREEITALKSAILFPDEMNCQLHELLEKQGSELKQAKQVIPNLQRQISSLTGQLQCLSEDLAEVKAVKYTGKPCVDGNFGSPRTPIHDLQEAANSLDFSDDDPTTPDSPDDMLLKDVNPCLTPCYSKMKSKEYGVPDCDHNEEVYEVNWESSKLSRSSDQLRRLRPGSSTTHPNFRRSDESKYRYGKRINNQFCKSVL
ncbi:MORC family CW-type zinc finger protein 3 [Bienertia sinuspersici]